MKAKLGVSIDRITRWCASRLQRWVALCLLGLSVVAMTGGMGAAQSIRLTSVLTIPGEATDLFPLNGGLKSANLDRLGGFFSDLYYDRARNVYYGLVDRGPGGGVMAYETRVQKFALDVDADTGAISGFRLLATIPFKTADGEPLNGLNPLLLNNSVDELGNSADPEGFVVAPNGNFYVSDEYGPWVREFSPTGQLLRSFSMLDMLIPKDQSNSPDYVDGRPRLVSGRQDNRGFEGLAITPDGSKLLAILQDPLVNEGNPDGRYSRNIRIVQFDTATGRSTKQFIYQLDPLSSLNSRIPSKPFSSSEQGRSSGVSAIVALNDTDFLVIERDNRGVGVEDPLGKRPIASKRVYKISLKGATDVSRISLAHSNALPKRVVPVQKSSQPFLDIAQVLQDANTPVPEKFEGLAIGPQLKDGSYAVIFGTDNDFSVTQSERGAQLDVCNNSAVVPLDSGCLFGSTLLPTRLYSVKMAVPDYKPEATQ